MTVCSPQPRSHPLFPHIGFPADNDRFATPGTGGLIPIGAHLAALSLCPGARMDKPPLAASIPAHAIAARSPYRPSRWPGWPAPFGSPGPLVQYDLQAVILGPLGFDQQARLRPALPSLQPPTPAGPPAGCGAPVSSRPSCAHPRKSMRSRKPPACSSGAPCPACSPDSMAGRP